jgi:hypothetical protein
VSDYEDSFKKQTKMLHNSVFDFETLKLDKQTIVTYLNPNEVQLSDSYIQNPFFEKFSQATHSYLSTERTEAHDQGRPGIMFLARFHLSDSKILR